MAHKVGLKTKRSKLKLNPQQELFCHLYIKDEECFGSATKAYMCAYDTKPEQVDSARKAGSRLMTKVDIAARISYLLEENLSSRIVDQELAKIIIQNNDLTAKVSAIREYNKIRNRTSEKLEGTFTFSWIGEEKSGK